MGVRGLRFYLSRNCPSTMRHRDIVLITSTYRRKTSKIPTIVVDAPTCIFGLFDKIDLHCPGQIQEVKEIVERFVNAFRKNNIKLIFFFDGPWLPDDHLEEYWRSNRALEVRCMQTAMNEIKDIKLEEAETPTPRLSWVGIFFRLFLKVLYKDDPLVEVYFAMENTRTLVIADYAIRNDCVAILSDDTIYLYYTDTVPVMSCKKLNLTKMTTLISNRNEICRELQIKKEHLKILAALTASEDLVELEEYYPFYEFITDGRYDSRSASPRGLPYPFEHILKYIRRFGNLSYREIVDRLTADITIHGTEDLANLLRAYMMGYELNRRNPDYYRTNIEDERATEFTDHESIVNFFTRKLITCDIFTTALELIKHRRVVIWTTPLQGVDDRTLIGHVQLFRAIRQRLYGFINNSPGIETKKIIEVWASFEYEHTEESVDPIVEPFNELSMTELWKSPAADIDVGMDCLLKCFGFTLAENFLDIPIKFQPLAIVLRYLFKHPEMNISEWEISSFIVQAITLSADNPDNKFNQTLESLDSRACHLAGLFVDGIILYLNVSLCCRLELQSYMPWNYFEGKKFQYYYQKMKSGETAVNLLSENGGEDVKLLNKQLLVSITS